MRPMVHTEKHYVQSSLFTVASGAITQIIIAQAIAAAPSAANHVREGSTISAVYVEMWLTSDDASAGSVIVTLEKLPGSGVAMTTTEAGALSAYDNKKNVLHTQMGLLGPNDEVPIAVIKGWFKIPKGKRRMGLEDGLMLNIFGQSNGVSGCGFFTYKEQF